MTSELLYGEDKDEIPKHPAPQFKKTKSSRSVSFKKLS